MKVYRIVLVYDYNGGGVQGWREKEQIFLRPGYGLIETCAELLKDFADCNHPQNAQSPRVKSAEELQGEFTCGSLGIHGPIG